MPGTTIDGMGGAPANIVAMPEAEIDGMGGAPANIVAMPDAEIEGIGGAPANNVATPGSTIEGIARAPAGGVFVATATGVVFGTAAEGAGLVAAMDVGATVGAGVHAARTIVANRVTPVISDSFSGNLNIPMIPPDRKVRVALYDSLIAATSPRYSSHNNTPEAAPRYPDRCELLKMEYAAAPEMVVSVFRLSPGSLVFH
jgi:hypothetical protein